MYLWNLQFIYEWAQSLDVCWGATNYHGNETTHGQTPALLHFHNQPNTLYRPRQTPALLHKINQPERNFISTFLCLGFQGIFCLSRSLTVLGRSCHVSFLYFSYILLIFSWYFLILTWWYSGLCLCGFIVVFSPQLRDPSRHIYHLLCHSLAQGRKYGRLAGK